MTEKSEKTFNRWVRKYPLAALSGLLLSILLIVSIFGSTLLPDKTPYANRQITELPLKKAFTKATLLIQDQTVWPVRDVVRQDKTISGQRIISSGGETIPFEMELSEIAFTIDWSILTLVSVINFSIKVIYQKNAFFKL